MTEFSEEKFKKTLSRFATGVCVITIKDAQGVARGITVNSFASVSLEPPLILFCLEKKAHRYVFFEQAEFFCINILSRKQDDISTLFARSSTGAWEDIAVNGCEKTPPLLKNTCGAFLCTKDTLIDAGDHSLFLCKVTNLFQNEEKEPLVYYLSQYGGVVL